MNGFLGETIVTEQHDTNPKDMALLYIFMYGGIDGSHHKDWVLDRVARILNGAPVTITEARWDNGHTELRYAVGTCDEYDEWVAEAKDGEDGPNTYGYDEGTSP